MLNIEGVGQAYCDEGLMSFVDQLKQHYGLIIDAEHPLFFDLSAHKWAVVQLPDNGRD